MRSHNQIEECLLDLRPLACGRYLAYLATCHEQLLIEAFELIKPLG